VARTPRFAENGKSNFAVGDAESRGTLSSPDMQQDDLGDIIAKGRATSEQWAAYWSAYADDLARQRSEHERDEADIAGKQDQQRPSEQPQTSEISYPSESTPTPPRDHTGAAGAAGISLGSAIAVVLSFQLNHSILWAIVHGIFSWFHVAYRAWHRNY
jgi:hypothetical protein